MYSSPSAQVKDPLPTPASAYMVLPVFQSKQTQFLPLSAPYRYPSNKTTPPWWLSMSFEDQACLAVIRPPAASSWTISDPER